MANAKGPKPNHMKQNNYYHWLKLQRKYRNIQRRLHEASDNRLTRKLDIIARRLHNLNRKWKLGISTAMLTAWLTMTPNTVTAQVQSVIDLGVQEESRVILFKGHESGDNTGRNTGTVGDINNDGFDDFAISAYWADPNGLEDAGSVYVVFGQANNAIPTLDLSELDGTNGFRIDGLSTDDRLGQGLAGDMDLNGDEVDDLVIGAHFADPNGNADAGSAYVIFGSTTGFGEVFDLASLNGTNGFVINGENAGDQLGRAIDRAGDINGDGWGDLVVGASQADPNMLDGAGSAYVIFGKNIDTPFNEVLNLSDLTISDGFRLDGGVAGYQIGWSVAGIGDFNDDTVDDLAVGSFQTSHNGNFSGSSYIIFGKNTSEVGDFDLVFPLSGLNGTNGFRLDGAAESSIGFSLSGVGDFNADGFDDMVIGGPFADPDMAGNAGSAYVFFGSNAVMPAFQDLTVNGVNGFSLSGNSNEAQLGISASGIVDFNGDEIPDVIIGERGADPNDVESAGTAYLLFGRNTSQEGNFNSTFDLSTPDGINFLQINGSVEGGQSGYSTSSAGDFNGDGLHDVLVAAPNAENNKGYIYLVFGFEPDAPYVPEPIPTQAPLEDLAYSFAVGSYFTDPDGGPLTFTAALASEDPLPAWLSFDPTTATFSGTPANADVGVTYTIKVTATDNQDKFISSFFELFVQDDASFPTDLSQLVGANGFRIIGEAAGDRSGYSVSSAGDVNGDGIVDLLVGAPLVDATGDNSGAVYVVFGSEVGFPDVLNLFALDGTNGFRINGEVAGDELAISLSGIGDLNGDDIDDILLGTNRADPNGDGSGVAYVMFGKNVSEDGPFDHPLDLSTLQQQDGFRINGVAAGDNLGFSLRGVGDINNDTFDDILIGAWGVDNITGAAYVILGKDTEISGSFGDSFDLTTLNGDNGFRIDGEANGFLGIGVGKVGDLSGDGIDDLAMGSASNYGIANVIYGKDIGSSFSHPIDMTTIGAEDGFRLSGEPFATGFGFSITGGDIDGDEATDIIVGGPFVGTSDTGAVYALFGRDVSVSPFPSDVAALLNGSDGFRLDGIPGQISVGHHLSTMDFDADSYDDIIIGVPVSNFNGDQSGSLYIVFGRNAEINPFEAQTSLSNLDNGAVRLDGTKEGYRLGSSVSSAGDINNDGYEDLLVGAVLADSNGLTDNGVSYVLFGRPLLKPIAPELANPVTDQLGNEGETFSFTIPANTFTDPSNDNPHGLVDEQTLSASLAEDQPLPAWLSFNEATQTFNGTPGSNDGGTLTIEVTTTDETGLTATDEFQLLVNQAPKFGSAIDLSFKELTAIALQVAVIDPEGQPLTYSLQGAPEGMSMTNTGIIQWTPTEAQDGTYQGAVTVNDPHTSATMNWSLEITEVNSPPVITGIQAQSVPEGEELTLSLSASDPDLPAQVLTFSLDASSTAKGMTVSPAGAFSWTPGEEDDGDHTVTVQVTDGTASATLDFNITVQEVLGVGEQLEGLAIYPNPSDGELNLSLDNDYIGTVHVRLIDLNGKQVVAPQVWKKVGRSLQVSILTEPLKAGIYIAEINQGDQTIRQQVVINVKE